MSSIWQEERIEKIQKIREKKSVFKCGDKETDACDFCKQNNDYFKDGVNCLIHKKEIDNQIDCPCCRVAKLKEMEETECGDSIDDNPYQVYWIECPNCHTDFDNLNDVQLTKEDIEQELASKHDDTLN